MRFSRTGTLQSKPQNKLRAAQYLRMSTDHQKYSTENQADLIAKYAEQRGLTIVRTYQDDGKSGLRIKGRAALKQLIADATSGDCDFQTVLVYDVSRWGRFQDVDESAYYEFICKEAGIAIHYCAEQFENDGSPLAALIKSLKRTMAAEYSRELSAKVFAGQSRLVALGYWQGSAPGFGMRRLLVNPNGKAKFILKPGEYKSIITDRVILVPGPPREVALVRRIYDLFVFKRRSASAIARTLNDEGLVCSTGRSWSYQSVFGVLKSERYIGNNVFNRKSQKLHQRTINNPTDMWIRNIGCFEPIIETKLFLRAKRVIERRKRPRVANEKYLLDCLRTLLARKGRLSKTLIESSKLCPSASTYKYCFGSLPAAYQRVGFRQLRVSQLLPREKSGRFGKCPRPVARRLMARKAAQAREWRARKRASK